MARYVISLSHTRASTKRSREESSTMIDDKHTLNKDHVSKVKSTRRHKTSNKVPDPNCLLAASKQIYQANVGAPPTTEAPTQHEEPAPETEAEHLDENEHTEEEAEHVEEDENEEEEQEEEEEEPHIENAALPNGETTMAPAAVAPTTTADVTTMAPGVHVDMTSMAPAGTADVTTIAPGAQADTTPSATAGIDGMAPGSTAGTTPKAPAVTDMSTPGSSMELSDEEITTESPLVTDAAKEPYHIDIPLQKKVSGRTKRKLWAEIEKRKPLIPTHVAEHIEKYAKPPFQTWGVKSKQSGSGACFGCK